MVSQWVRQALHPERFSSQKVRMFWTVRGANAILALRCCHLNSRLRTLGDRVGGLASTSMTRGWSRSGA